MADDFESLKPVILITGLPGEGKTLYAVSNYCKGKSSVFTAGLKGSVFPEVDATKWYETPSGSVVVVDEAWKWFAPKNPTQEPPEHYKKVPEIRHSGHVLVLVTQHPQDLDSRIRRRVGKHYHVVRIFGSERANIHEWNHCHEDVEHRSDTESFVWEYDKASYGLYKSADQHRIKVEIPRRIKRIPIYLGLAAVGIVGGVWWAYQSLSGTAETAQPPNLVDKQDGGGLFGGLPALGKQGQGGRGQREEKKPMTTAEYLASMAPRIEDLRHTAPRYDELTKPTRVPVPAACMSMPSKGCKCWTQDATPYPISADVCQQIVAGGVFLDFRPEGESRSDEGRLSAEPAPQVVQAVPTMQPASFNLPSVQRK